MQDKPIIWMLLLNRFVSDYMDTLKWLNLGKNINFLYYDLFAFSKTTCAVLGLELNLFDPLKQQKCFEFFEFCF